MRFMAFIVKNSTAALSDAGGAGRIFWKMASAFMHLAGFSVVLGLVLLQVLMFCDLVKSIIDFT
eukprot:4337497-Amphidinium_carterae.2